MNEMPVRTKKFDADLLRDIIYGDTEWSVLVDELLGSSRWDEQRRAVFKYSDGKLYQVDYSHGLTEMQDTQMFDGLDEVKYTEVRHMKKTVIVDHYSSVCD